jgi:hypothetical protein
VDPRRLLSACLYALHFSPAMFSFTTSPHIAQQRTGTISRLWFRFEHWIVRFIIFSPSVLAMGSWSAADRQESRRDDTGEQLPCHLLHTSVMDRNGVSIA